MSEHMLYDEKYLLSKIAAGDRHAFNQLYSKYIDDVFRFVLLFAKTEHETEEILQEVFINIWEKRETLVNVVSFKSYVLRAAKNRTIDRFRHLQIKEKVLTEIRRTRESTGESTAHDLAYKQYYQLVKKAIHQLPPKRKLIFQLNVEAGLSHDEIAEKLNISKSVVKKQLYTAYNFVREYLAQHGELSTWLILLLSMISNN
jgi:RNA polymerase sigma-70 factor (family 1)